MKRQVYKELYLLESTTYDDVRQLSNRESLRDLIVAMEAHAGKLYHLGIGKSVTRSNLNKANEQRNYRIFEEFATDSSDAKEQKNNITFTERFRDLP